MEQRRKGVVQLGERQLIAATGAVQQCAEGILRVITRIIIDGAPPEGATKHAPGSCS